MPLDAICLSAVREELSGRITGMKIEKVQQPERDVVIVSLRGASKLPCRLLISAGSGDARAHITEQRFDNPQSPPMFCMLLRKHLTSAKIISVSQPPTERILEFSFEAPDALGSITAKHLILELIGRSSNLILTDPEGLIIDCLRRTGGEESDKRAVLPGLFYRAPAAQEGKTDPFSVTEEQWQKLFDTARERSVDKWLLASFTALSPLICRELSWRAYSETDKATAAVEDGGEALRREFFAIIRSASSGKQEPWAITGIDGAHSDFSYTRILQYEGALELTRAESFSAMLDVCCTRAEINSRVRQRASAIQKTIKTARDRLVRKLVAQREELAKTALREELRECGDIITANIHIMKKGQNLLVAADFYSSDGKPREIVLDTLKSPQQNAAKYYKEYKKAKNAEAFLTEQIRVGENELEYLESVITEIALIENEQDLAGIRNELLETGFIREKKQKSDKSIKAAPIRFISSAGMRIHAGRSNSQNDELTMRIAAKSDVWLHAQKLHGAHVIISCEGTAPDEQSLYEAAAIAAYYSEARSGGKTPVDYTQVKHVKKIPGGRPGMVIYTDYKTIVASPDEELVNSLRDDVTRRETEGL